MTVYNAIIAKLDAAGVLFERHEHVAVRTSQEASAIRGTRMEEGAKALVLCARMQTSAQFQISDLKFQSTPPPARHASQAMRGVAGGPPAPPQDEGERHQRDTYILAVLAADRQVDIGKLRQHLGMKKLSLASPEEVLRVTGCEVGGVPPFGSCLTTPLQTYCDPSLSANMRITFNAGLRTHSLTMAYADWGRVERPIIITFALGA